MKQHSPRQYLFFYLVFVLATAIISTTAMDGGIDVEERYPGVEVDDSLKSEKASEGGERLPEGIVKENFRGIFPCEIT